MSITEIETAIRKLSSSEVSELMVWLDGYQDRLLDKESEDDLEAGRFDGLIAEAYASGQPTPLTAGDIDEARRTVKERIASRAAVK